jgi:hypothetical protein
MAVRWKEWAAPALIIAATVATGLLNTGPWDSAGDVKGYAIYADAFWHGTPLFHALPQEYPPLALLPFSLTLSPLPGAPLASFIAGFGLLFFVGYLCFRRFASRAAAARYALYLLLGAQGTLLDRYDLAPALLSVAALWCAERKRFGWAYAALAAGAALKLYPLVLLPVIVIAHYHSLRAAGSKPVHACARLAVDAAIALILTAVLVFVPALITGQQQTWLAYATNRPVQVESVPGTLVWLGTLLGAAAQVENSFGSQGWVGGLSGIVAGPSLALGITGFLWLWWRQARGHVSLPRAALASLCLLFVSGKVLSAQYLIWLLPVAALAGGLEPWWIALAVLTSLDYPLLFPYSKGIPPLSDWLVRAFLLDIAVRNALLVGLTLRLLSLRPEHRATNIPDNASESLVSAAPTRSRVTQA